MPRLVDRLSARYRAQGFYEGMASGASVVMTYGTEDDKEGPAQQLADACRKAYASNGIVHACILARMMLFSEAVFKFRSNVDKHLYGSTELRILEDPSPNQTTGELLARMEQDVSIAGNSFTWRAEDNLLVRLPPDEVTIISEVVPAPLGGTYRRIIGYDWEPRPTTPGSQRSSRAHTFHVDEVAHWSPYPDEQMSFRGRSWMTPIAREIAADSGLTAYKMQYLDHAATPNMIVKYQQKLRPDTVDRVVERFQERFGGVANAWRPLVLDQGSDATVVGDSLNQLDFKAVQGAGETRIAAAAGVPPIVVGLSEGLASATYSNYQTAMRRFTDLTMRPLWRSVCAALQKLVNVPGAGRLWYDVSDIAALRQSEIEMAQVMQVHGATLFEFMKCGFTPDSAVQAIVANDLSMLKVDTSAPPAGPLAVPPGAGAPPEIPAVAQQPGQLPPDQRAPSTSTPQTAATKIPMPASFVGRPSTNNGRTGRQ